MLGLSWEVTMGYRMLAETTMIAHFAFVAYVAVGGFVAWRWLRTWWLHLAAIGWAVTSVAVGLDCPLTAAEDWFRERAGERGLPPGGFIDYYIEGVVYPEEWTVLVRSLLVVAVAVSWAGACRRWRAARRGVLRERPRSTVTVAG
jgi:hypothetical protein